MNLDLDLNLSLFKYSVDIITLSSLLNSLEIPKKITDDLTIKDFDQFANLLNLDVSNTNIRDFALGYHRIDTGFANTMLSSYRSINELVRSLYQDKGNVFTVSTILRMNKVLTDKTFEVWESGKFRTIEFPYQGEYDFIRGEDLSYDTISTDINMLVDFYQDSQYPNILKIPIIGYNLLKLKPFSVLNDFTILFIMKSLMIEIEIFNDLSLVKIFSENLENMQISNQSLDTWVGNFFKYIYIELLEIYDFINKYISLEKRRLNSDKVVSILSDRQKKAFLFFVDHRTLTRQEYSRMFKISPMTAFRDLDMMKELGILTVFGKGRGTKYTIMEKYLL